MAILLKELRFNYAPKGESLLQLLRDFYAMFSVWREEGSGGQPGATTGGRAAIIDDLFGQVAQKTGETILKRFENEWKHEAEHNRKDIQKLAHTWKMQDWMNFSAHLTDLLRNIMGDALVRGFRKLNPKTIAKTLSPSIQQFVKSTKGFEDVPEPVPAWKQYDKPLKPPKDAASQRELPIAGSQTHLPFPKFPTMPDDLPKMATPMAGTESKRLGGNWEQQLAKFNYQWDEEAKEYKNPTLGTSIKFEPNLSSTVKTTKGQELRFANLGQLFIALEKNRKQRHGKEPIAQVTENDFVKLYEFLYT